MRTATGLTLLEILVALAVLAVLLATAWAARPHVGGAARDAAALRAFLTSARLRALAGTPRAVTWTADRWVLRAHDVPERACADGAPRDAFRPRPDTRVEARLRDGVVWLPDGTGRSCDGGGVYGGRITLADEGGAWSLVVSSSGRIRRERLR